MIRGPKENTFCTDVTSLVPLAHCLPVQTINLPVEILHCPQCILATESQSRLGNLSANMQLPLLQQKA